MTYVVQNFRHASGAVASYVPVEVLNPAGEVVDTLTTDNVGNVAVDLPPGDYRWRYRDYTLPFTIADTGAIHTSAVLASQSAETATGAAEVATDQADRSSAAADASAQSASESADSASAAQGSADAAAGSSSAAAVSATEASNSEQAAAGSATVAQGSANAAAGSAQQASDSAAAAGSAVTAHEQKTDPHTQYARKDGTTFSQNVSFQKAALFRDAATNVARGHLIGDGGGVRWWQYDAQGASYSVAYGRFNDKSLTFDGIQKFVATPSDVSLGGVGYYTGTGSPEGVLAAVVGSRYVDKNATNGAIEWIKASGTGTTGWKVAYGDTGWRDVSSLLSPGFSKTVLAGVAKMRRINDMVWGSFKISIPPEQSQSNILSAMPAGFRASDYEYPGGLYAGPVGNLNPGASSLRPDTSRAGLLSPGITGYGTGVSSSWSNTTLAWAIQHVTNDGWPTALPGVAA